MRDAVEKLWRQWLEMNGQSEEDCPVPGMFTIPTDAGVAPGVAAAIG